MILPRSQAERLGLGLGATMRFTVGAASPAGLRVAGIVERGDGGYRLTADGRELMELLRPLGQWSQRWAARAYAADSGHARSSNEEVR